MNEKNVDQDFKDYRNFGVVLSATLITLSSALLIWVKNFIKGSSKSCLINGPIVIPAKAGIQVVNFLRRKVGSLGPRFRGGDGIVGIYEIASR